MSFPRLIPPFTFSPLTPARPMYYPGLSVNGQSNKVLPLPTAPALNNAFSHDVFSYATFDPSNLVFPMFPLQYLDSIAYLKEDPAFEVDLPELQWNGDAKNPRYIQTPQPTEMTCMGECLVEAGAPDTTLLQWPLRYNDLEGRKFLNRDGTVSVNNGRLVAELTWGDKNYMGMMVEIGRVDGKQQVTIHSGLSSYRSDKARRKPRMYTDGKDLDGIEFSAYIYTCRMTASLRSLAHNHRSTSSAYSSVSSSSESLNVEVPRSKPTWNETMSLKKENERGNGTDDELSDYVIVIDDSDSDTASSYGTPCAASTPSAISSLFPSTPEHESEQQEHVKMIFAKLAVPLEEGRDGRRSGDGSNSSASMTSKIDRSSVTSTSSEGPRPSKRMRSSSSARREKKANLAKAK